MRIVALRGLAVSVVVRLPGSVRFGTIRMSPGEGRQAAARRSWLSVVAGTFRNAVLASVVWRMRGRRTVGVLRRRVRVRLSPTARGNPVVSSKGTSYFNDMLGTTLGAKVKGKYSAAALTAFGEDLSSDTKGESSTHSTFSTLNSQLFFTGKPHVAGLGHAFLFRNYRAGLAKWQTADPLGYSDGWNRLAYCMNESSESVDLMGGLRILCRDMNASAGYCFSAGMLTLVEGGSSQFEFSFFDYAVTGDEITIMLDVSLNVSAGLRRNCEFAFGEVSKYKKHTDSNNDSRFENGVFEAVCAHERGHAESFFSDFIPYFTQLLMRQDIDQCAKMGASSIEAIILACYQSAVNHHKPISNTAANSHTYFWYATHKEWSYRGKSGNFDKWVKE